MHFTQDLKVFNAKQMAAADQITIATGIPGDQLMERAGQAVVDEIIRRYGKKKCLILCGPGNNGGDGFVVARKLKESGFVVDVSAMTLDYTGDAKKMFALWDNNVGTLDHRSINQYELIVDALFGTGLERNVMLDELIDEVNNCKNTVVAIDISSGVNSSNGSIMGNAIRADLTVTFMAKKVGHLLYPGRAYTGEVVVVDIGIDINQETGVYHNDKSLWNIPAQHYSHHKYSRGHVVVCGGNKLTSGAACLSSSAALRSLAGAVTIIAPEESLDIYCNYMASLMFSPFSSITEFKNFLIDRDVKSVVIGPGTGNCRLTREKVKAVIESNVKCIIDADAISAFQDNPAELFDLITNGVVITPHEGEFQRLFSYEGDKLSRCLRAACESGAVVVLKGADTVIASPNNKAVINSNALPTLATAGSGDVLAGIIAGLAATGMDVFEASCAGVWIHGQLSHEFGKVGLIAEDMPGLIPNVLHLLTT